MNLASIIVTLIREIIKIKPEAREDWQTYIKLALGVILTGLLVYGQFFDDTNEAVNQATQLTQDVSAQLSDGGAD